MPKPFLSFSVEAEDSATRYNWDLCKTESANEGDKEKLKQLTASAQQGSAVL